MYDAPKVTVEFDASPHVKQDLKILNHKLNLTWTLLY